MALLVMLLAAACGQKGPLYLPGDPSEIQTEVPGETGTSESEDDENSVEDDEENDLPR